MTSMNPSPKKVVIIGGGFAGLKFLQKLNNTPFSVTLIDKQNHHQFQPLFYQVASAGLEPSSISFPFRKIFQNAKNISIRMATALNIHAEKNYVETDVGNFVYDYLVLATGSKTNFYNNKKLEEHCLSMKTTQDAIKIRNRILTNFEQILNATSQDDIESLYNIVVVGGGPTGVELSGAFAEIKKHIIPKDYPYIDFSRLKIILLESNHHTLNNMSNICKINSQKYLKRLGVVVHNDTRVLDYDGCNLILDKGLVIKSKNVIWTAGVMGNVIKGLASESVVKNRFLVNRFSQVQSYTNIFAIGDVALMQTPKYPNGHPQLANVAIHQGINVAMNLLQIHHNKPLKPYEYRDLGTMATIGRHKAVVQLPFLNITGRLAWYIWMFLHLMLILKVKNKLIIFINWTWSYFGNDSSLRLILNNPDKE